MPQKNSISTLGFRDIIDISQASSRPMRGPSRGAPPGGAPPRVRGRQACTQGAPGLPSVTGAFNSFSVEQLNSPEDPPSQDLLIRGPFPSGARALNARA
ncbi:hypothetical protein cyc_01219 [Cyclospora cayetanensis]|uniref:Uncharacterized protein n=1 Tax=Cyclospora cayetanensis TaxID=88456 RepID=A0A1D3D1V3_9EIME|nr:hypothetical protein cyc_01219 [Cyclospora cayetanensis]